MTDQGFGLQFLGPNLTGMNVLSLKAPVWLRELCSQPDLAPLGKNFSVEASPGACCTAHTGQHSTEKRMIRRFALSVPLTDQPLAPERRSLTRCNVRLSLRQAGQHLS